MSVGCDEALRAAAEAWGDGPLTAVVRRHLESCAACSRRREVTDRLLEGIAGEPGRLDGEDPGPAYWATFGDRVRARLEAPQAAEEPPRGRLLRPVALAAAVALLAAAAALYVWSRQDPGAGAEGGPAPGEALTGLKAIHEDPGTLERRMEEALRSAQDPVTLEDLALFPSHVEGEAFSPAGDAAGESLLDSEEALSRAGEMAALLAGRAGEGWAELDLLVDGLSQQEARMMIDSLEPRGTDPSPAGA